MGGWYCLGLHLFKITLNRVIGYINIGIRALLRVEITIAGSLLAHGRVCKELQGLPTCAANGVTEMELGRDAISGKML
jgi:hypothetical protein